MVPPPAGAGIYKWDEIRNGPAFPSQAPSVTRVEGEPFRKLWQVYLDNLDVLEIWDFADLAAVLAKWEVSKIMQQARTTYDYHGIPRSEDKAEVRRTEVKALGNRILGRMAGSCLRETSC